MTTIAIIGGTGYTGSNIAREAASRGHSVTAVSRHAPAEPVAGVTYIEGDITDAAFLRRLAAENDVLVSATHFVDEDGFPLLPAVITSLADAAIQGGARLGVVGGAGSTLVAPGGPRLVDTPDFHDEWKAEALAGASVLYWLRGEAPEELDWFYLSPAAAYGGFNPGERTGSYRVSDEVLVTAEDGSSFISGADFAIAFVDEIEEPKHRRARFTVGY